MAATVPPPPRVDPANRAVAARLDEVAGVLQEQGANPFRVRAYRLAAETLRHWPESVEAIVRERGVSGLEAIPNVGPVIARAIRDLVVTGRLPLLDRLRGESDPQSLLATVPGVGPRLAERLHDRLGIGTLEDLELAAHDGRLAALEGIGPKRLAGIVAALRDRLGPPRKVPPPPGETPSVAELLSVDEEYRRRAAAGELPRIAPRRFNPERNAWLPVLHTTRGNRHYTALFSNTARAHQLGRTRDWVVIYYDGDRGEHQCTVVTATRGPLAGRRVVRGREAECLELVREGAKS
jgi:hypothetical protein